MVAAKCGSCGGNEIMSFLKKLARHQAKHGVLPSMPPGKDWYRGNWTPKTCNEKAAPWFRSATPCHLLPGHDGQHWGNWQGDPLRFNTMSDADRKLWEWHSNDRACGGACKFCGTEVRCPSTLPPFKYSQQQCDLREGHEDEHWFHDGMTRYLWTDEHMPWCGLDLDHQGMCHPPDPDDGTRPEPSVCGHERPFEMPSDVTCTLEEGHEGNRSAPMPRPSWTWINTSGVWAWPDSYSADVWDDVRDHVEYPWFHASWCKDYSHSGLCSTEVPREEPVRAVCWDLDQTGTRRCDLDEGHHGVHSGGVAMLRCSWLPCCCEAPRGAPARCSQCPVHDGPYAIPSEPTEEGTEAPQRDTLADVLIVAMEALSAAMAVVVKEME